MLKKKVLVVDDSAFMRKVISDMINKDESLEVIGTARNGEDALRKIQQLKPDVITLDVEMPVMNGLEALHRIMTIQPTPVIMLSTFTKKGADITIEALANGAVDFVPKPGGPISLNIEEVEKELIQKIKIASQVKVNFTGTSKEFYKPLETVEPGQKTGSPMECNLKFPLVLIGTSTGGPKALDIVLQSLPENLPAGVLIVQHMHPGFTRTLAERLDRSSPLKVKEAENGEKVLPGHAYVAPGDYHLEVELKNCEPFVKLHQGPTVNGHRPAVDTLFNSVAEKGIKKVIAVIMTGMGYDGREGLVNLKKNGCYAIAEAQETCVVFGMPKSAIDTGCVDKVVPLPEIASGIINYLVNFR